MEEIQRLFESADFESVVRLLQPTLNYGSRSKTLEFVSSAPERPAQLILLQVRKLDSCVDRAHFSLKPTKLDVSEFELSQNSQLKLEDHQQCLECSELALNEALQQLTSPQHSGPPTKEEWVCTIRKLLDGIDVCFTKDLQLLNNVPHFSSTARLANNLIQVRKVLWITPILLKEQSE